MSELEGRTCDRCLFGRRGVCEGRGCARWDRAHPSEDAENGSLKAVARARRGLKGVNRAADVRAARPGRPYGARIDAQTSKKVAELVLEGEMTRSDIAVAVGVTYEQVRTVERNLKILDGQSDRARGTRKKAIA